MHLSFQSLTLCVSPLISHPHPALLLPVDAWAGLRSHLAFLLHPSTWHSCYLIAGERDTLEAKADVMNITQLPKCKVSLTSRSTPPEISPASQSLILSACRVLGTCVWGATGQWIREISLTSTCSFCQKLAALDPQGNIFKVKVNINNKHTCTHTSSLVCVGA